MIPNRAHFVWVGANLPWLHSLAPLSAARHGGFDEVILHHDQNLSPSARDSLRGKVQLCELDPKEAIVYRKLGPTALANHLRLRILRDLGGVYLDMDTLTISSFGKLLGHSFFCGRERVVFSESLLHSRNPLRWTSAVAKTSLRRICRWMPRGVRLFQTIAGSFESHVSNAVLGSLAGHPILSELLEEMERRIKAAPVRPKDLGVRLLQKVVERRPQNDRHPLVVLPEPTFYPLPPDISAHWFRPGSVWDCLDRLDPETRCVHWYASLVPSSQYLAVDQDWVWAHRHRVGLAELVSRLLPEVR